MKSVLDSRQLLAARVLAETGSFTLAGHQLSLTQSAVSHAIKALEEEVECKLFIRTGRGVKVSIAGEHFLQYTDKILAEMETARTLVAPRTTQGKQRLRVSVGGRVRNLILPVVQPAFQREYGPKLVVIEPRDYSRSLELLESGLLDLAFTVRPMGRPDFGYFHLFEDELRFVVSPSHPWALSGRVSREDLAGGLPVLFQDYNNSPALLAEHFKQERLAPRHVVPMPDYDSVKKLALTGQVAGVLPLWLVTKELAAGTLVTLPIGSRPMVRQCGLAYVQKLPLTAMDRRFMELCRLAVPGILSRLQGGTLSPPTAQPAEKRATREKKEEAPVAVLLESCLKYSGSALFPASAQNLLSESAALETLKTLLKAVS
jgi:DNA-binding transcriptional LysR family regulator